MTPEREVPSEALADVVWLARSENRLLVLAVLTSTVTAPGKETPSYARRELAGLTGTSRTTLGRILSELEERGWAKRNTDGEYEATSRGQHVAAAFEPVVNSVAAIRHLGDAVALLPATELAVGPTDEIEIDLRHFADATVNYPDGYDPTFFGRYFGDLVEGATSLHWIDYVATPEKMMDATAAELHDGDLSGAGVFPTFLVEHFRENPGVGPRRQDLAVEGMAVFEYEGHIPCNLFVIDDTVLIENSQVDECPDSTVIETRNETVRAWAMSVIERYIEASRQVDPEELPVGPERTDEESGDGLSNER